MSLLALALVPTALAVGAGVIGLRSLANRAFGPGFVRAIGNAGELVGDLLDRYEAEAAAVLERLPTLRPPDAAAKEAGPPALAVDWAAWEGAPAVLYASAARVDLPGLPTAADWELLRSGSVPPRQVGRVLRFFRAASPTRSRTR